MNSLWSKVILGVYMLFYRNLFASIYQTNKSFSLQLPHMMCVILYEKLHLINILALCHAWFFIYKNSNKVKQKRQASKTDKTK